MAMYPAHRFRNRGPQDRLHPVAAPQTMADPCDTCSEPATKDWAGDSHIFALLWGVPSGVISAGGFLEPMPRAITWTVMLPWMGGACIANARRCQRTHCRFTGPFLILMAALVAAYAAGVMPLGPYGWHILASAAFIGSALLWWGSERILGAFTPRKSSLPDSS
jgi:hypothetical protein